MKNEFRKLLRSAFAEPLESRLLLAADLPEVWSEAIDAQAAEVNQDPGVFRVYRTGSTAQPLAVDWQPAGWRAPGLSQGGEYTLSGSGVSLSTITIPAGSSYVDVTLSPLFDLVTEDDLVAKLGLGINNNGSYVLRSDSARVTIEDRPSPQTISIDLLDASASESGDDPAYFMVRRSGDLSQSTSLSFLQQQTVGTPSPDGFDFAGPLSVNFEPGQSEQLVFVSPNSDDEIEGTEAFSFGVTSRGDAVFDGSIATITIADGPVCAPVTISPVADGWVGSNAEAATLHGSDPSLNVRDASVGTERVAYLKFDLSTIDQIEAADLKLWSTWTGASGQSARFVVYGVEDANWDESTLLWSNRPTTPRSSSRGGSALGGASAEPRWTSVAVTSFVRQQKLLGKSQVTLMIVSEDPLPGDGPKPPNYFSGSFASRESDHPPQLTLYTASTRSYEPYVSHRKLSVNEGGSVSMQLLYPSGNSATPIRVLTVPGSDPDIVPDKELIQFSTMGSVVPKTLTFTARPDADDVNGVARFLLYSPYAGGRVITVTESDTGVAVVPTDTVTVPAIADGYAQLGSSALQGLSQDLRVLDTSAATGDAQSFLHFDLTSLPAADQIASAQVVLYGQAGDTLAAAARTTSARSVAAAATSAVSVGLFAADPSDWYWQESALRWATKPSAKATAIATQSIGIAGAYSFEIGDFLRQQKAAGASMVTLALQGVATGTTAATFASLESGKDAPRLVVSRGTPPPPLPPPAAAEVLVNFQPASAPTVAGYLVDGGQTFAARNGQAYGWTVSHTDAVYDRQKNSNQLLDTHVAVKAGARWELAVPNGVYTVTIGVGDSAAASKNHVWVEGVNLFNYQSLNANQFASKSIAVPVNDGRLTIGIGSSAGGLTRIDFVKVTSATSPPPVPPPPVSPPPVSPPPVSPPAAVQQINFQPASAPTVGGYAADGGQVYGSRNGMSYGWTVSHTDVAFDRQKNADQLLDTNIAVKAGTKWEMGVANGTYKVTVGVGDSAGSSKNHVWIEGVNLFNYQSLAANQFASKSITVVVTDGRLTLGIGSSAGGLTHIDYIRIAHV